MKVRIYKTNVQSSLREPLQPVSGRTRTIGFMSNLPLKTVPLESHKHGDLGGLCSGPAHPAPHRGQGERGTHTHTPAAKQSIGGCSRHHGCLSWSLSQPWWASAGPMGDPCCPWGVLLGSSCYVRTLPSRGSRLNSVYQATAECACVGGGKEGFSVCDVTFLPGAFVLLALQFTHPGKTMYCTIAHPTPWSILISPPCKCRRSPQTLR